MEFYFIFNSPKPFTRETNLFQLLFIEFTCKYENLHEVPVQFGYNFLIKFGEKRISLLFMNAETLAKFPLSSSTCARITEIKTERSEGERQRRIGNENFEDSVL